MTHNHRPRIDKVIVRGYHDDDDDDDRRRVKYVLDDDLPERKSVKYAPDGKVCITEDVKAAVLAVWKKAFPDAVVSKELSSADVLTLTHSMGPGHKNYINGLLSKSPLANNALLTVECAADSAGKKRWLNLYEIMIPDIPGTNGGPSTSDVYSQGLLKRGLHADGNHYHWAGMSSKAGPGGNFMHAIHNKGIDIDPVEFSEKVVGALTDFKKAAGM